jgi:hypothetical protein
MMLTVPESLFELIPAITALAGAAVTVVAEVSAATQSSEPSTQAASAIEPGTNLLTRFMLTSDG